MSKVRLSPEAEAEIDGILTHIAGESSIESADRVVESITECFWLLAQNPYRGASARR